MNIVNEGDAPALSPMSPVACPPMNPLEKIRRTFRESGTTGIDHAFIPVIPGHPQRCPHPYRRDEAVSSAVLYTVLAEIGPAKVNPRITEPDYLILAIPPTHYLHHL